MKGNLVKLPNVGISQRDFQFALNKINNTFSKRNLREDSMVNLSTCSETKFGLSSSSNIKRIYRSPSKANMFESFSKRHIKYFYFILLS